MSNIQKDTFAPVKKIICSLFMLLILIFFFTFLLISVIQNRNSQPNPNPWAVILFFFIILCNIFFFILLIITITAKPYSYLVNFFLCIIELIGFFFSVFCYSDVFILPAKLSSWPPFHKNYSLKTIVIIIINFNLALKLVLCRYIFFYIIFVFIFFNLLISNLINISFAIFIFYRIKQVC